MANRNQVVGQVKIRIDGETFSTDGQSTMEIGGTMREAVTGDYEAGAFKAATKEAKVEVNLLYKPGVSLTALRNADDVTVTLTTDTGTTWIMRNAYCVEPPSFSGSDGKAKVIFQSGPAEEIV